MDQSETPRPSRTPTSSSLCPVINMKRLGVAQHAECSTSKMPFFLLFRACDGFALGHFWRLWTNGPSHRVDERTSQDELA
uniref:Uncharacterized protein n=1 Tax=Caenorhabditis japonica TaxID=281687 RepID=A0A8R1EKG8_CAEJA